MGNILLFRCASVMRVFAPAIIAAMAFTVRVSTQGSNDAEIEKAIKAGWA